MAVIVMMHPKDMDADSYDQASAALVEAGIGQPAGRLLHASWDTPKGWHIMDIWESEEEYAAFAATLAPILAKAGLAPQTPKIYPAHNIID